MTRDRAGDYEELRAMVVSTSIIPRSAAGLMRYGMAAWLNAAMPSSNVRLTIVPTPGKGVPAVIASICLRLARGAVHA